MKEKIVKVIWKDITFYAGSYYGKDIKEYSVKIINSVGYVIENTKEFLTIAMGIEQTEEDKIIDFLKIPKGNIIKIIEI